MAEAIVARLSTQSTDAPAALVPAGLLSDEASELISSSENARAFLERLVAENHSVDAIKCVARLMPRHYVLVWGLSTLRRAVADSNDTIVEADRAGIALAERWLSDSSEESRLAAQLFAEEDGYSTPGGWISAAAAWMAGSLGPPECELVEPPATLPGEAVAAALVSLAARDPEHLEESLGHWVIEALEAFGGEGEKI